MTSVLAHLGWWPRGCRGAAGETGRRRQTIVVGDPAAATTVQLYEDPRCPVVEEFEATGAPALREMTLRRKTKTEYTLASFRDDRVGGDGSKRAVDALRAALDAGKFTEYHAGAVAGRGRRPRPP
ncbi:thioredoxin domain-containing protein [Streptomyces sp. H27-H1]|uniref:thioredoxin domain-containing protein n=1 Tax=Streptomyces sp. H27-H1 TaxID=2996461 RepID=UPI003B634104